MGRVRRGVGRVRRRRGGLLFTAGLHPAQRSEGHGDGSGRFHARAVLLDGRYRPNCKPHTASAREERVGDVQRAHRGDVAEAALERRRVEEIRAAHVHRVLPGEEPELRGHR